MAGKFEPFHGFMAAQRNWRSDHKIKKRGFWKNFAGELKIRRARPSYIHGDAFRLVRHE
jgi:hypothetical protein